MLSDSRAKFGAAHIPEGPVLTEINLRTKDKVLCAGPPGHCKGEKSQTKK